MLTAFELCSSMSSGAASFIAKLRRGARGANESLRCRGALFVALDTWSGPQSMLVTTMVYLPVTGRARESGSRKPRIGDDAKISNMVLNRTFIRAFGWLLGIYAGSPAGWKLNYRRRSKEPGSLGEQHQLFRNVAPQYGSKLLHGSATITRARRRSSFQGIISTGSGGRHCRHQRKREEVYVNNGTMR